MRRRRSDDEEKKRTRRECRGSRANDDTFCSGALDTSHVTYDLRRATVAHERLPNDIDTTRLL